MFLFSLKLLFNSIVLSGMSFVFITQFSDIINFFHSGDFESYIEDRTNKISKNYSKVIEKNNILNQEELVNDDDLLMADTGVMSTIQIINNTVLPKNKQKLKSEEESSKVIKRSNSSELNKSTHDEIKEVENVVDLMMKMPISVNVSQKELDICFKENNQKQCEILITKVLKDNFNY